MSMSDLNVGKWDAAERRLKHKSVMHKAMTHVSVPRYKYVARMSRAQGLLFYWYFRETII